MRDLRDKRVLVTGGGHGIGRAICLEFARGRANCLVSDVDESRARETAEAIQAAGGTASPYALDVTDHAAIAELRDRIHDEHGPIDVLVNNAGIVFGGAFLDVPLEKHVTTYEINTIGLVAVTHTFLPDLIGRGESHLVHIASASGFVGLPFGSTYASSKWSVVGFSESIRLELAELGHGHVGVTAVCPGYVKTGLFDGAKQPRGMKLLTPEQLARDVVTAVQRNRAFLIVPGLAKTAPMMRGLLPLGMLDAVGRFFGLSTTMKDWRGHTAAEPAERVAVK